MTEHLNLILPLALSGGASAIILIRAALTLLRKAAPRLGDQQGTYPRPM